MKKTTMLILACALLIPAIAVLAQEEGGPPQGEGPGGPSPMAMGEPKEHPMTSPHFADKLDKILKLSDEQKTKVQQAIDKSKDGLKKKFQEVRKVHQEMQALEKDLWNKIRATLTDEQKKILDKMEGMRMRGPGMRPGMGRGRRSQRPTEPGGMGKDEGQPPQGEPGGQE